MQQEIFQFSVNNQLFNPIVFYKSEWTTPRATVLIYHAFEGINDVMKDNAKRIVDMGYVAITIDLYGNGQSMTTFEECAGYYAEMVNNRETTLHQRLTASVAAARAHGRVNPRKIAAIGFCFGGLCVLDIARMSTDIQGVVSVHGVLAPPPHHTTQKISAKVLVCHGHDDPQIPQTQINAFMTEMDQAEADWQFMIYSRTKHAFSDPNAHKIGPPEMGREYNALTTERGWRLAQDFFNEVL